MRIAWLILGFVSLGAGIVGLFLPLLPTVPFLLLATISFSRSSERLHQWLLNHPVYGPPIARWQQSGAISRRAKLFATGSILAGIIFSIALGLSIQILAVQAIALGGALLFIWTRPEG